LINNRQGGRRRGRGGQRGQNLGGQPGNNRQDNRQRGNAAQLLEKYKNMARDAQLSGDRVQMEYYLQFADHYFRILSENRARFDDQTQRRPRDDDYDGDDGGDEEMADGGDEQDNEPDERPERSDRSERPDRSERFPRRNREQRPRARDEQAADDSDSRERRPRYNANGGETIPFDILPPAIGRDDREADEPTSSETEEEPAPRPRRRRAARPAGDDGEVAPAA
jgi:hypothetical protein